MPFFDQASLYRLLAAIGVPTNGVIPDLSGGGGYLIASAGAAPVAGGPSGAGGPVSSTDASAPSVASPPAPASAAPSLLSPAVAQAGTGNLPTSLPAAAPPSSQSSQPYLTAADMAGPVPRAAGGSGITPLHIAVLQALGFLTPDGNINTLGLLSAALQGASALKGSGGDGRLAPQAPAWRPGGNGIQIPQVLQARSPMPLGTPPQAPQPQVVQIPALLRAAGFGG
jgi:hypothetical protein